MSHIKTLAIGSCLAWVTAASGDVRVESSGTTVTLTTSNGRLARVLIPAAGDGDPRIDALPELGNLFGAGRRRRWKVTPQDGLEGEIWLSTYDTKDFVLLGGELTVSSNHPIPLGGLTPCVLSIERQDHERSRFFINSGNQCYSGSLPLTDPRACRTIGDTPAKPGDAAPPSPYGCSTVCAFRGADPSDCLAIGFVSMGRAEGYFARERKGDVLTIRPELNYGGAEFSPGQRLRLEHLMITSHAGGATRCLEEWADVTAAVVQPRFNHCMVGIYNTWYAYWTPQSNHGTADLWLKGADELHSTGLIHYGIAGISPGVWTNRAALGETETWPNLMPKGWKWTIEQVQARGVEAIHGGFWGHISECATVFKQHPEWMVRDKAGKPLKIGDESWGACPYPYYDLDVTLPDALRWLTKNAVQDFADLGVKFLVLDFHGFATSRAGGAVITDKAISWPTEADRRQAQAFRDALGEGCVIGVYTSPTNRLVGLVDRARMSVDAGLIAPAPEDAAGGAGNVDYLKSVNQRWKGAEEVARNMAAAYFYNQKLWINDPDPIAVGLRDQAATVEEARMRMMICANSGGFPTLGESPTRMDPGRLALFKKALPVYGEAARAVDLMDRDVASIHHLRVRHPAGDWDVVTLFNWDPEPRAMEIDLASLGIAGRRHSFEFWTQAYGGIVEDRTTLQLPGHAVRVYRLTPASTRPQVIGTDRHVTIGYHELPSVIWRNNVLSGIARRPQPEDGTITIWAPGNWKVKHTEGLEDTQVEHALLTARLKFQPESKPWRIEFAAPLEYKPGEDEQTKEQARDRLTIKVMHRHANEVKCDADEKHAICRDTTHWRVDIQGEDYSDPERLGKRLKQEADTMRVDARNPQVSERKVMIRGDATAPWGLVQGAMNICAKVGIYKIEVGDVRRGEEQMERQFRTWLPKDRGVFQGNPEKLVLKEIRVFMSWDPATGSTLREVATRGEGTSDAELMQMILSMTADYKRAGETDFPVLLDAREWVPWQDVIHVIDLCQREHIDRIEFAAPLEHKPGAK